MIMLEAKEVTILFMVSLAMINWRAVTVMIRFMVEKDQMSSMVDKARIHLMEG